MISDVVITIAGVPIIVIILAVIFVAYISGIIATIEKFKYKEWPSAILFSTVLLSFTLMVFATILKHFGL